MAFFYNQYYADEKKPFNEWNMVTRLLLAEMTLKSSTWLLDSEKGSLSGKHTQEYLYPNFKNK